MNREFDDKVEQAAEEREQGMSEDRQEALQEHYEKLDDWYATCPQCKVKVKGTLADMRAHRCQTQ